MKTLQLQNIWTRQSMREGNGRRRLTLASRGLSQPAPRRRVAFRRHLGMKLPVTFTTEYLSSFTPTIRAVS